MDCLQGLAVGPFGKTEHGPLSVVEPVGDVSHLILVLNGKIELMGRGDLGGRRTWRIVTIEEQGHDTTIVTGTVLC